MLSEFFDGFHSLDDKSGCRIKNRASPLPLSPSISNNEMHASQAIWAARIFGRPQPTEERRRFMGNEAKLDVASGSTAKECTYPVPLCHM